MTRSWPWPRDNAQGRLRRVAESYRSALELADPQTCRLIDARMAECGQEWICRAVIDVDRLVIVQEAAGEFGFSPVAIHGWARSAPGKIPVRGKRDGKILYRLGDLIRFHALMGEQPRDGR